MVTSFSNRARRAQGERVPISLRLSRSLRILCVRLVLVFSSGFFVRCRLGCFVIQRLNHVRVALLWLDSHRQEAVGKYINNALCFVTFVTWREKQIYARYLKIMLYLKTKQNLQRARNGRKSEERFWHNLLWLFLIMPRPSWCNCGVFTVGIDRPM